MKNKRVLFLITTGIILIMLALCLLIYNSYVDKKAGKESKKVVETIQEELKGKEIELETIKIDGNEYIGIINIPTLNLELPVMTDWSYKKMKISPVRYHGSLENNDLVICAHAMKNLFGHIKNLTKGDILIFTDINGDEYLYEVKAIEILKPEDIEEMIESDFDLTLFTCTYDSQNRVTVRFNRIDIIND